MRTKRVKKFRRYRYARLRNRLLILFALPGSVFVGYLLTSVVILPLMKK